MALPPFAIPVPSELQYYNHPIKKPGMKPGHSYNPLVRFSSLGGHHRFAGGGR